MSRIIKELQYTDAPLDDIKEVMEECDIKLNSIINIETLPVMSPDYKVIVRIWYKQTFIEY